MVSYDFACIFEIRTAVPREKMLRELLGPEATEEEIKKEMDKNPCRLYRINKGIGSEKKWERWE